MCKCMWTFLFRNLWNLLMQRLCNLTSFVSTDLTAPSAVGDFWPLLLAEFSQLRHIRGTSGMNGQIQFYRQRFYWIDIRIWLSQSRLQILYPSFLDSFAGMFRLMFLLQNPFSATLQLPDWWQVILIQNLLMGLRIHIYPDNIVLSSLRGRKTAPDVNISTIMLHCWNEDHYFVESVDIYLNMALLIVNKQFYHCHMSKELTSRMRPVCSIVLWQSLNRQFRSSLWAETSF